MATQFSSNYLFKVFLNGFPWTRAAKHGPSGSWVVRIPAPRILSGSPNHAVTYAARRHLGGPTHGEPNVAKPGRSGKSQGTAGRYLRVTEQVSVLNGKLWD